MKSRSTSSGKPKTADAVPVDPVEKTWLVSQTGSVPAQREAGPAPATAGETVPELKRVIEHLTADPGATLFIAHPLSPEHQKKLAQLLLADAREEAGGAIQKLQKELAEAGNSLKQRTTEGARLNDDLVNVLEILRTPVIVVDNELRILRCSQAAEQILNISPDSVGHDMTTVKLAIQIPGLRDILSNVIATAEVFQQEVVDDLGRWFKLQVGPFRTGDGRIDGAVLAFPDIDAEKRNEVLLHSYQMKEERYREVMSGFLIVLDVYGTVMMINRIGCELLGVAEVDIIGMKWFDSFVPKSHAGEAHALFEKTIKGEHGKECEYPVLTKAGGERTISWRCALMRDHVDNISGMICSGEDRTSVNRTSLALQESKDRFCVMMETVRQDEFFTMDPEGYIGTWMTGEEMGKNYTAEDLIGQHFSVLFSPEDFQSGKPMRILELVETEGRYEETTWRIRKDGTKARAYVAIIPVRDDTGKLVGFSCATRYLSGQVGRKETLESSFASLHGYPLRDEQS